jgi:hypothetical protein
MRAAGRNFTADDRAYCFGFSGYCLDPVGNFVYDHRFYDGGIEDQTANIVTTIAGAKVGSSLVAAAFAKSGLGAAILTAADEIGGQIIGVNPSAPVRLARGAIRSIRVSSSMGGEFLNDGLRLADTQPVKTITIIGSSRDTAEYFGRPGFNVLNLDGIPEAQWRAINTRWIDDAVERGDEIWLVTDPAKHAALMTRLGKNSYYLSLELPRLQALGAMSRMVKKY